MAVTNTIKRRLVLQKGPLITSRFSLCMIAALVSTGSALAQVPTPLGHGENDPTTGELRRRK